MPAELIDMQLFAQANQAIVFYPDFIFNYY
jgi:hypothetical protein